MKKDGYDKLGVAISVSKAKKMCFNKKSFDTRNDARDYGRRGVKLYGDAATITYKCPLCGHFHLTTRQKGT
jgi:hypothetical protein